MGYHGHSMRIPWASHGHPTGNHGHPKGIPWVFQCHGISWASNENPMDIPWASHGHSMDIPRASRGHPTGNHGHPMGIPRTSHGHPTGIPWASQGHPTGILWASHRRPMGPMGFVGIPWNIEAAAKRSDRLGARLRYQRVRIITYYHSRKVTLYLVLQKGSYNIYCRSQIHT